MYRTIPDSPLTVDKGGAKLKNIKTGEEQAVSYEHIRKIKLAELLALLPQNFDSEITKTLDTYRYKKGERELEGQNKEKMEEEKGHTRKLRSGRLYLTHQVPRNFFSNFSTIFGYSTP